MKMTKNSDNLPENELRKLAAQKNAKGNATREALKAQKILYERLHWPCAAAPHRCVDQSGNVYTRCGVRGGNEYD